MPKSTMIVVVQILSGSPGEPVPVIASARD